MAKRKLNDKHEIFVQGLVKGMTQRTAYKAAFDCSRMKDKTVDERASRLFSNDKVRARYNEIADRIKKEAEDECIVTVKDIIRELKMIAFANGADYAKVVNKIHIRETRDDKGVVIGTEEIPYQTVEFEETDRLDKSKLPAISGIKKGREGMEVKLNDKMKALELLGRHLKMFEVNNSEIADGTFHKIDKIMQSLDDQARGK